jgi:hypothetical protein
MGKITAVVFAAWWVLFAAAQAPEKQFVIRAMAVGTTSTLQTLQVGVSQVMCGVDAPTTGTWGAFGVVDPEYVFWNDLGGKVCLYNPPSRTRLFPTLSPGEYEVTVAVLDGGVEGAASDRASFKVTPERVTGVRLGVGNE